MEDDGTGFAISKVNLSKQIGIIQMWERVNAASGIMLLDSVKGYPYKITITNLR